MLTGIDHVVVAVADPDAAAEELQRDLGLEVGPGGRHEALGTFNRLAWCGDTYIELIGVFDQQLAESSWLRQPILRALARGGGLAMWAIASDDLPADAERLRAAGATLGPLLPGERRRPDGRVVRWQVALPHDFGPSAPFLIEHDPTGAEWTPDDRAARAAARHPAGGPVRLEVLEIGVADVNEASKRLRREDGLAFRPSLAGGGARDANVGDQVVRLRPAPGGSTLDAVVRLSGPGLPDRAVERFRCRWQLRPA